MQFWRIPWQSHELKVVTGRQVRDGRHLEVRCIVQRNNQIFLEFLIQCKDEVFRVFSGDVFLESRNEVITVFGDRAE
jgi:hypothetical protein